MNGLSKIVLATLGLVLLAGTGSSIAQDQKKVVTNPYECFTDDGYGRKRPCSAGITKNKYEGDEPCMTDEGNGRKRPCNALLKPNN